MIKDGTSSILLTKNNTLLVKAGGSGKPIESGGIPNQLLYLFEDMENFKPRIRGTAGDYNNEHVLIFLEMKIKLLTVRSNNRCSLSVLEDLKRSLKTSHTSEALETILLNKTSIEGEKVTEEDAPLIPCSTEGGKLFLRDYRDGKNTFVISVDKDVAIAVDALRNGIKGSTTNVVPPSTLSTKVVDGFLQEKGNQMGALLYELYADIFLYGIVVATKMDITSLIEHKEFKKFVIMNVERVLSRK